MIGQVLQRMNRREQVLAGLVVLVVFVLANLFLWSWVLRAIGDSRVEVAKRKQTHNEQTVLLRESDLWAKREQWLREHQQDSLPSKRKVRGRHWFIFSTMCRHLMLSLFLRAQILPSIRVIQRKCVVSLKSRAGMRRRAQQSENHLIHYH